MAGVVIIGVGPGIGRSVALRFAQEGLPVALVARSGGAVRAVAGEVAALGVHAVPLIADCTDQVALGSALDAAADELGAPDVVVYNAAIIQADSPGDLSVRGHQDAWAVNVVGAITAAAHVLPGMARRGSGTFIVTGGMPEPKPQYVSLSLGKAGVRTLVALLDQQYKPSGVHVATVTVAGAVAPGGAFDPDDIAERYWRLHTQPRYQWQREVTHDGNGATMSTEDRIERAGLACQQAVFAGDVDALDAAERELDAVEADLAVARGRVLQARSREQRAENPAELAFFQRATELYRALGDVRGEGEALFWVGVYHQMSMRDNDAAVPLFERSYELAAQAGDKLTMSYALRHLGYADHTAGRLDAARKRLEESTRLRREIEFLPGVAANLVGLAYVAAAQGRREDALALIEEAGSIADASGARAILRQVDEARTQL